jgi:hypothetical protein
MSTRPNHNPSHHIGITIDQEQRACYTILKHFREPIEQNEMFDALDVWPDPEYQAYLNGS